MTGPERASRASFTFATSTTTNISRFGRSPHIGASTHRWVGRSNDEVPSSHHHQHHSKADRGRAEAKGALSLRADARAALCLQPGLHRLHTRTAYGQSEGPTRGRHLPSSRRRV